MKNFDEVFSIVGGIGLYQIGLLVLLSPNSFLGTDTLIINFVGYTPDHWCYVNETAQLPPDVQKELYIPVEKDGSYSQCSRYEFATNSSNITDNPTENCVRWQYDYSVFGPTVTSEWNMVCSDSWLVEMISSITLVGCLFGAIFGGWIGDRYGRRISLWISTLIKLGGNILSAASPNMAVFFIARFISGFGSTTSYALCVVLFSEMTGPKYRSLLAMIYGSVYSIGFAVLSLMAMVYQTSQKMMWYYALAQGIGALGLLALPESPRWLILQGKRDEADKILRQMAKINRKTDFDLNIYEFQVGDGGEHSAQDPSKLFKTPAMRKRTIITIYLWFTVSLVFLAMTLNASALSGNFFINNVLLAMVEIPGNLLFMFCMNHRLTGRRVSTFLAFIISGISSLVSVGITSFNGSPGLNTALALIGKATITGAFNGIYLYTLEYYPTEVRTLGIGTANFAARLGGIVAPYFGGTLGSVWTPLPSLIFGICSTVAGCSALALPETLNTIVPDTVEEVEEQVQRKFISLRNSNSVVSLQSTN